MMKKIQILQQFKDFLDHLNFQQLNEEDEKTLQNMFQAFQEHLQHFVTLSQLPPTTEKSLQEYLVSFRANPLLSVLSHYDLKSLAMSTHESSLAAGEYLFQVGEPTTEIYLIQDGKIQLIFENSTTKILKKGDLIGLQESFSLQYRNHSAKAISFTKVYSIQRDDFVKIVIKSPHFFEQMVAQLERAKHRTQEVLNHTTQPLCKITKEGVITPEFSPMCAELLGISELEGNSLFEIINFSDEGEAVRQAIISVFEFGIELFDTMLSETLIRNITYQHPDGTQRFFRLEYYPIARKGSDQVEFIDIGFEDQTQFKALEIAKMAQEEERKVLGQLLYDPASFFSIFPLQVDFYHQLHDLEAQETTDIELLTNQIVPIMRTLHTLKGISSYIHLEQLKETAHHLEQYFSQMKSTQELHSMSFLSAKRELEIAFTKASEYFLNLEEDVRDRLHGMVISPRLFDALKKAVYQDRSLYLIEKQITQIDSIPARSLVKQWTSIASDLGAKLGKVTKLSIEGGNFLIPSQIYHSLQAPLVHLIRNAMDHGIEHPNIRRERGKAKEGKIDIHFFVSGSKQEYMNLEVKDDGNGMIFSKLLEMVKQNPTLYQKHKEEIQEWKTRNEEWRILFLPGFSSRKEVTTISGRGFGLDALYYEVSKWDGDIWVESRFGEGMTFRVKVKMIIEKRFRPIQELMIELHQQFMQDHTLPQRNLRPKYL